LDPPAHAIVLSVDEKSPIQALDRTPPGLPLKKGRAGTVTHDYKRHGTTTLFAALNVLDGLSTRKNSPQPAMGRGSRSLQFNPDPDARLVEAAFDGLRHLMYRSILSTRVLFSPGARGTQEPSELIEVMVRA
jgi:hypothetical protein